MPTNSGPNILVETIRIMKEKNISQGRAMHEATLLWREWAAKEGVLISSATPGRKNK